MVSANSFLVKHNDLHAYVDCSFVTDYIYLDLAKVLDKVSNQLLLTKLSLVKIYSQVLQFIRVFLNACSSYPLMKLTLLRWLYIQTYLRALYWDLYSSYS